MITLPTIEFFPNSQVFMLLLAISFLLAAVFMVLTDKTQIALASLIPVTLAFLAVSDASGGVAGKQVEAFLTITRAAESVYVVDVSGAREALLEQYDLKEVSGPYSVRGSDDSSVYHVISSEGEMTKCVLTKLGGVSAQGSDHEVVCYVEPDLRKGQSRPIFTKDLDREGIARELALSYRVNSVQGDEVWAGAPVSSDGIKSVFDEYTVFRSGEELECFARWVSINNSGGREIQLLCPEVMD